jgi:pimeloyl-ACP methyl ester carboxylesterase
LSDKEREQAWILKERLKESDLKNRDDIFLEYAHLSCKGDDYHVVPDLYPGKGFSAEIHENVWSEASKMRETGELIELVKQVKCPVLAIHGAYDPHPWKGVDAPLKHILTNFEMVLLPNCGHNPWNEVEARTQFFIELAKAVID